MFSGADTKPRHASPRPTLPTPPHTHISPHLLNAQAACQLRVLLGLAAAQLPTRALEACTGTRDRQYQYLERLQVYKYKQCLGSLYIKEGTYTGTYIRMRTGTYV